MFFYSDPPYVMIEEVWLPHKNTFEVRLVCHVTSYPSPNVILVSHVRRMLIRLFQVTWFKNGNTKLSTSDEIVMEDHEPKHVLKIEKLKVKNFGIYKISGKPRPPIFSGDQREILSSVKELNITWSTDSMTPITQYLLAYRKSQVL